MFQVFEFAVQLFAIYNSVSNRFLTIPFQMLLLSFHFAKLLFFNSQIILRLFKKPLTWVLLGERGEGLKTMRVNNNNWTFRFSLSYPLEKNEGERWWPRVVVLEAN